MANETELVPVYDKDQKCVVAKPLKDLVANKAAYLSRGWCMAEVEWSSLRSGSQIVHELYLDIFLKARCLQVLTTYNESCDITATEDSESPAPKNRWSG